MAVDIMTEVLIRRPLGAVAAFAADPDNAPEWYVNIKSVEWETPLAIAVGARIAFVAHFLGRRMAYTYEIVEYVPDVLLVMRTAESRWGSPAGSRPSWRAPSDGRTERISRS